LVFGCTVDGLFNRWSAGDPFTAKLLLEVDDLSDERFFDLTEIFGKCTLHEGVAVVQRAERWTCDQQVVGSNPARSKAA